MITHAYSRMRTYQRSRACALLCITTAPGTTVNRARVATHLTLDVDNTPLWLDLYLSDPYIVLAWYRLKMVFFVSSEDSMNATSCRNVETSTECNPVCFRF